MPISQMENQAIGVSNAVSLQETQTSDPVSQVDDASGTFLPPSVPASMPTVNLPHTQQLTGLRIFLDICCGVNSPLSQAVQQFHGDVMRFDILVHYH